MPAACQVRDSSLSMRPSTSRIRRRARAPTRELVQVVADARDLPGALALDIGRRSGPGPRPRQRLPQQGGQRHAGRRVTDQGHERPARKQRTEPLGSGARVTGKVSSGAHPRLPGASQGC